jgi:hypothetical protein
VPDKSRLPTALTLFSMKSVEFKDDDQSIPKGVKPVQVIAGVDIDIDFPTVIIVQLDQSLLTPYSASFFESAIQPVLADAEFMQDLRRTLKRAIHPRFIATIIEERVKKMAPPEIYNEPEKLAEFYNGIIAEVEATVNGANPEDAFVGFDNVEYGFAQGGHTDVSSTLKAVQEVLNSKLATGAKTMPVVLGHTDASNASSTQSLLYLKNADMIRRKLNEFYSRALTVAVRLFGDDVYVEFKYASLDLRPDAELEAFKAMKQSRILEQLSLGMISDEEACIQLTGNLPREGYVPLAGTGFHKSGAVNAAPTSNTGVANTDTPPRGREPSTPTQQRGSPARN